MGFLDRARKAFDRARQSIAERIAPPPLPTAPPPPPQPGRTPREDREISRPPQRITERVSRSDLPSDWGRNQAALWADAAAASSIDARDEMAQRFYDAALYTRASEPGERAEILENFKQYIRDVYGVEWDDVFDWEDYRAAYDQLAG